MRLERQGPRKPSSLVSGCLASSCSLARMPALPWRSLHIMLSRCWALCEHCIRRRNEADAPAPTVNCGRPSSQSAGYACFPRRSRPVSLRFSRSRAETSFCSVPCCSQPPLPRAWIRRAITRLDPLSAFMCPPFPAMPDVRAFASRLAHPAARSFPPVPPKRPCQQCSRSPLCSCPLPEIAAPFPGGSDPALNEYEDLQCIAG